MKILVTLIGLIALVIPLSGCGQVKDVSHFSGEEVAAYASSYLNYSIRDSQFPSTEINARYEGEGKWVFTAAGSAVVVSKGQTKSFPLHAKNTSPYFGEGDKGDRVT